MRLVLVIPKQHRSPQLLITAKPTNDDFCILVTRGRRVLGEQERAIIGYATDYNYELLKRLHRKTLTMQQAVMLGIYLVSQSKKLDKDVGGDTRVAVVRDNGAWFDDAQYIANSETRVLDFLRLADELFLNSVDMSISPSQFAEKMQEFSQRLAALRERYLRWSAAHSLNRAFHDPDYAGDPYSKEFLGCVTEVRGDGAITVREDTPEEIEVRRKMFEAMKQEHNKLAGKEFLSLIAGRGAPLYIGEEKIHVRGTTGPVPEPAKS